MDAAAGELGGEFARGLSIVSSAYPQPTLSFFPAWPPCCAAAACFHQCGVTSGTCQPTVGIMMLASPCKLPTLWSKYIEQGGNRVALRVNSKDLAPDGLNDYTLRDSFTSTEYAQPSIVAAMVHLLRKSLDDSRLAQCLVFAFVCGSTIPLLAPAKLSEMLPQVVGEQGLLGLTQDFKKELREEFLLALNNIAQRVPMWAYAYELLGPWVFQPCSQFIVVSRKLAELLCTAWPGNGSWPRRYLGHFADEYALIRKEMLRMRTREEDGYATFCCLAPDEMVWTPFLLVQLWRQEGSDRGSCQPSDAWITDQLEKWRSKPMKVDMVVAKEYEAMCQKAGIL